MILFNADLGEGVLYQGKNVAHQVAPYIHLANISCGAHAGDEAHIKETIEICLKHNVLIGAHPSYPDRATFGRESKGMSHEQIKEEITKQIIQLQKWVNELGSNIHYVKPHGALYLDMMKDEELRNQIEESINNISSQLKIILQPSTNENHIHESFIDRQYQDDMNLVSRKEEGSVYNNQEEIESQFKLLLQNQIVTRSNKKQSINFQTICIHCDNESVVRILPRLKATQIERLNENSILLKNIRLNPEFNDHLKEKFPQYTIVPAYETIYIEAKNDFNQSDIDEIEKITNSWRPTKLHHEESILEIPIFYGLDLNDTAKQLKITPEELIERHSKKTYTNYAMGFLPGFAYLGNIDEKLILPRKEKITPVKAKTLAIAENQTAIYPLESPGGWHQIGKTPLDFFDDKGNLKLNLKPGQKIRFIPISQKEFEKLGGEL